MESVADDWDQPTSPERGDEGTRAEQTPPRAPGRVTRLGAGVMTKQKTNVIAADIPEKKDESSVRSRAAGQRSISDLHRRCEHDTTTAHLTDCDYS